MSVSSVGASIRAIIESDANTAKDSCSKNDEARILPLIDTQSSDRDLERETYDVVIQNFRKRAHSKSEQEEFSKITTDSFEGNASLKKHKLECFQPQSDPFCKVSFENPRPRYGKVIVHNPQNLLPSLLEPGNEASSLSELPSIHQMLLPNTVNHVMEAVFKHTLIWTKIHYKIGVSPQIKSTIECVPLKEMTFHTSAKETMLKVGRTLTYKIVFQKAKGHLENFKAYAWHIEKGAKGLMPVLTEKINAIVVKEDEETIEVSCRFEEQKSIKRSNDKVAWICLTDSNRDVVYRSEPIALFLKLCKPLKKNSKTALDDVK
ncbi:MAG: hypothetical protein ACM3JI_05390 [Anaerolineae bacterium]